MFKKALIILAFLFLSILPSIADVDIIHPKQKNITINSPETYFMGNVQGDQRVYINSKSVPLWENSFFVEMVPLKVGMNKIEVVSNNNGYQTKQVFHIKRNEIKKVLAKEVSTYSVKQVQSSSIKDGVLYAKTINDFSTVRNKPVLGSTRVIDLQKDVILYLDSKKGDFYKIADADNDYWVHKSIITPPVKVSQKFPVTIKRVKTYSDKNFDYVKFYTSHPTFYSLKNNLNSVQLTIYGTEGDDYVYTANTKSSVLGYDAFYEDNNLVLRIAKTPEIFDVDCPLKDINIFIDAGHGGKDKGALSPERTFEKDINLDITNKLISLLKKSCANVYFSRDNDEQVDLYDRVSLSKKNDTFISLSIHCNSLPYGKNPFERHGSEVHYYNDNAKELSQIIVDNLSRDLGIKNNGIHRSSFAVVRQTNPISVLVEVAYLINPEEYLLLRNESFRYKVAQSIKNSLEEYICKLNCNN